MLNFQCRQPSRTTMARTLNLALLLSPITWDLFKAHLSETMLLIKKRLSVSVVRQLNFSPRELFLELFIFKSLRTCQLFPLRHDPKKNFSLAESMYSLSNNTHASKIGKPGDSLIKRTHISRRNAGKFTSLPHNFSAHFFSSSFSTLSDACSNRHSSLHFAHKYISVVRSVCHTIYNVVDLYKAGGRT